MPTSYLNQNNLPRGIRNNNPGNLVATNIDWQGKIPYANNRDWSGTPTNIVKQFEQFNTINYGIRALAMDIINDVSNSSYTLTQLMNEYAPAYENNTAAYIQFIANNTGINPNAALVLTGDVLAGILRAIIDFENGTGAQLVTDSTIKESIQLLPAVILNELGAFANEHKGGLLGAAAIAVISYGAYRWWNKNKHAA